LLLGQALLRITTIGIQCYSGYFMSMIALSLFSKILGTGQRPEQTNNLLARVMRVLTHSRKRETVYLVHSTGMRAAEGS